MLIYSLQQRQNNLCSHSPQNTESSPMSTCRIQNTLTYHLPHCLLVVSIPCCIHHSFISILCFLWFCFFFFGLLLSSISSLVLLWICHSESLKGNNNCHFDGCCKAESLNYLLWLLSSEEHSQGTNLRMIWSWIEIANLLQKNYLGFFSLFIFFRSFSWRPKTLCLSLFPCFCLFISCLLQLSLVFLSLSHLAGWTSHLTVLILFLWHA